MTTHMVRIRQRDHALLSELSKATGKTIAATLSDAVTALQRQHLITKTNEAYAALKTDPAKWAEEKAERGAWECTLNDGIEKT